ncbi:hypothetical protein FJZ19_00900 [Candidatus Pacearchaeota archaeon]|nr:hypothetical protein [Candidatus Pacearchaeota archaeon]
MIKETKALGMAEVSEYLEEGELKASIKRFIKLKPSEAKKMREEIEKLGNIKIKEEHTAKIIDLLPEDAQDLAKIFTETSLDENENSSILEIVKKYK